MTKKIVGIIATLDTKGEEVDYLKKRILTAGGNVVVIDSGTGGVPQCGGGDISREMIAEHAGFTCEEIAAKGRGEAAEIVCIGLRLIVRDLYQKGAIHALLSIGGGDGALLASAAMRELPLGVPKLIVSPIAQGQEQFGPYVGSSDVMIMHSVIDILGINQISQNIYDTAVGAVLGMIDLDKPRKTISGKLIATTMYGTTTPAVMHAKNLLETKGYEVIVFHPNGTGGRAMEKMVARGAFCGVLDMTTHEIADYLFGGLHAGREDRLEAAGERGLPQLVAPGAVDFLIKGPLDTLTTEMVKRQHYFFNAALTLVRSSPEEMAEVGEAMAQKLNRSKGPTTLMIPLKGFSMYAREGLQLHDPEGDQAFISSVKNKLDDKITVLEVDAHINDPAFSERAAAEMLRLIDQVEKVT